MAEEVNRYRPPAAGDMSQEQSVGDRPKTSTIVFQLIIGFRMFTILDLSIGHGGPMGWI